MNFDGVNIAIAFAGMIGGGGVAWGAAKTSARQAVKTIDELKAEFKAHTVEDHEHQLAVVQRLTRLETIATEIHNAVVKK